ncbi:MAG TPA: beta-ketoacyl-[acyl-carrier-protein] synthase family protein [Sedimentisphaerales bacterium]|nr:beta-ketoacyl-[acyl-carrier-protein] synthase family protein [Sedimentisphaerales bacterium]HRS12061.1 beta-ketoacyl-[acyl-carrier-protein] synthase family protein [Sedimentisphaerales bacterium]HRV48506.1 beta-ketoacyl-[acyl-carrier-protein] synthase family protein [Sedimentisphaerales bacterium]
MESARVVVTGLGAVSPLGLNVDQMWAGLCEGRCGIGRIRAFDPEGLRCELAGEVPPYNIQDYVPRKYRKSCKLMCRDIELAVIAAHQAVTASGLVTKGIDPENVGIDPARMAITMGAGIISCDMVELAPAAVTSVTDGRFDVRKWGRFGLEHITPLWLLKYLPNMLACHVGIIHDAQGPSNTITCAEASAHLAIGEAAQVIARGDSDIALAGAAEAKVNPVLMVRQILLGRTNNVSNDRPAEACRPFDAKAQGSVFGEAGGVLVLESLSHARRRGATILAEVAGVGQSHCVDPAYARLEPSGEAVRLAIAKALDDAGIDARQLDLLIPHGTGLPPDDLAEARGIQAALGDAVERVVVWPTKSMLSTTGAAAGALDAIAAVKAITTGTIPAARNFDRAAEGCHLHLSTDTIRRRIDHAICCSYTHGGQTAALVIKRYDEGAA